MRAFQIMHLYAYTKNKPRSWGWREKPVCRSPNLVRSDDLFEYEKPTPAGDSRNRRLATARYNQIT